MSPVGAIEGTIAVIGLALLTVLTRAFFLLPEREWPLPDWLQQGLRYAPLAALMAVVAPEIVLTQGELISTWKDARLPAVAVASDETRRVGVNAWKRDRLVQAGADVVIGDYRQSARLLAWLFD